MSIDPDFIITSAKPVSQFFREIGIQNFSEAAAFVCKLPYGRIQNPAEVILWKRQQE